jgi:biopolymer transport protein ExbD
MNLRSGNKIKTETSMASMTDLVFLLLLFFVIMATMASTQLPVDLPSGQSTSQGAPSPVNVGITAENQYFLEENPDQFLSLEELETRLRKLMARDADATVRLHADKASEVEYSVQILGLAKQNQWKIVLVTK